MSDLELEQAVIAPRRWIELCGWFKKQHPGDLGEMLCSRTTRIITDVAMRPIPYLFLAPGGRYLVVAADKRLFVWDLGYVSNANHTLIASVVLEGESHYELDCMVQSPQTTWALSSLCLILRGKFRFVFLLCLSMVNPFI